MSKFYVSGKKPEEVKLNLILMGEMGVGKSTILEAFKELASGGELPKKRTPLKTTMVHTLSTHSLVVDGIKVKLLIWDTAGQERFRSSMPVQYFRDIQGCILVYDITQVNSFKALGVLKDEVLLYSSPIDPVNLPFILLGNKSDLTEDRKVSERRVRCWCSSSVNEIPHLDVSALTGENIQAAFDQITNLALKYYFKNCHKLEPVADSVIHLENDKSKKFWSCCP